jgi:hypothetical protein
MADDEHAPSGPVPGLITEFLSQLRAATERLEGMAGIGEQRTAAPSGLVLPGTLSATQLRSIADNIAAQRRSIKALQTQLSSFDEQLAVLEQLLGPFTEWSRAWAELEQRWLSMSRRPRDEALASQPIG